MNTKKIAAALRALADAVDEPEASKPMDDRPPTPSEPVDQEPVTLEDLQDLGSALLKRKKRDEFIQVLKTFELKNLSAADQSDYPAIWEELKKAGG